MLSTDDFVQPDAKLEHKKSEALVLFRGSLSLFSGFALRASVQKSGSSISFGKSSNEPIMIAHGRLGYLSLSLSRQTSLWPLEMNSNPPPQHLLGRWCIHATINSSSLEDYIGCKASTGIDDDGVNVSRWYGLGANSIEENSIPPLRDKFEFGTSLNPPMKTDHPSCKLLCLEGRENVQAESASGVAVLQPSLVAMWRIAFIAGHYLLSCWSCHYITVVCMGDRDVYKVTKFSQLEKQGFPYPVGSFTWSETPGPSLQRAKSLTSGGNKGAVLNVPANFTTLAGSRPREAESKALGQPGTGNEGSPRATRQRVTLRLLTSWCDTPWVKMEAIETIIVLTLGILILVIRANGFTTAASVAGTVASSVTIVASFEAAEAEPFKFQTDIERVIEGIDRAVIVVKTGEVSHLTIAPEYDGSS
ncbi:hypothetical protein Nepgr_032570 [Nepenthes gracilis]|uniref:peptidylprolyl isomerase n=1 Tax=Nepenthes gracilis TaxID=150966 RepID=A0AAD3TJP9_NEPGR|nr:hypothetical protein Nepgr_032570 [Nepenthes gracilis]